MEYDVRQFQEVGYNPKDSNVFFHKRLFDDTVWPGGPIAYAHLDGDWYDSTMGVLKRVAPYLSIGGYFVLDDVYDYSGAQDAYTQTFLTWITSGLKVKNQKSLLLPKTVNTTV